MAACFVEFLHLFHVEQHLLLDLACCGIYKSISSNRKGCLMSKSAKQPVQQKPRLGRGLSSLMGNHVHITADDQEYQHVTGMPPITKSQEGAGAMRVGPQEIQIAQIAPNPYQPRREFSPEELNDLSQSITQQGVLQPLIVTPSTSAGSSEPYTLIAGERRLRAAKLAGLATVPCVIRQASAQQMLEWALIENIQRSDLNAVEKATAYRDYMDRFSLSAAQAAERLGQARTTVANHLRLLDLCDAVQRLVVIGQLSFGHAKILAGIVGDQARQIDLANKVIKEELSVRQLEGLMQLPAPGGQDAKVSRSKAKPPFVRDLEEQLTHAIGTRVSIQQGRSKSAGRIVVDYYSLEDFDRIAACLGWKTE